MHCKGINYYRLKMIDKDGHAALSTVKSLNLTTASDKMQLIKNYNLNRIIVILPPDSLKGSLRLIDGMEQFYLSKM